MWTYVRKLGGWLSKRPDGQNDKFFYYEEECKQYIDERNKVLNTR